MFKDPEARKTIRFKLVKNIFGDMQLETENGELLGNMFVQSVKKIKGQFAMELKVVGLSDLSESKNW